MVPGLLLEAFEALNNQLVVGLAEAGHDGLTYRHFAAMAAIADGARTAVDLAAATGVTKQAASKTIDQLVARDYAERDPDEADRRRLLIRLTGQGRECVALGGFVIDRSVRAAQRQVGTPATAASLRVLRTLAQAKPD